MQFSYKYKHMRTAFTHIPHHKDNPDVSTKVRARGQTGAAQVPTPAAPPRYGHTCQILTWLTLKHILAQAHPPGLGALKTNRVVATGA